MNGTQPEGDRRIAGELAEAKERIAALTGLLDAIAALADHPMPARVDDPAVIVAFRPAADSIAIYADSTAGMTTGMLRNSAAAIAEKAARPLQYEIRDSAGVFGTVRAAYLDRNGLSAAPGTEAEPEAVTAPAPGAEPEAGQ